MHLEGIKIVHIAVEIVNIIAGLPTARSDGCDVGLSSFDRTVSCSTLLSDHSCCKPSTTSSHRHHGMNDVGLQTVFMTVVVSMLTCVARLHNRDRCPTSRRVSATLQALQLLST